ncbi:Uma2 family endonuclease [Microcoleus sp. A003_D6]|uniref:Uma2 family endonuclease n=1 Tax=Microcoleus sp. A003_D6 TaxID=3055266 RepID=UPI002FD1977F
MSQSIVPATEEKQLDTSPTLTFEEYRFYKVDDEIKHELHRGQLIPIAMPTILHINICDYLVYKLQHHLAKNNLDLVVKRNWGVRTEENSSRIPDIVVCTKSLLEQVAARPGGAVLDFDETPLLLIEVVGKDRRADYILKRGEYEQANVPEYCIVDPTENRQRVRVMAFPEGDEVYSQVDYLPGEDIVSVVFPNLRLSVDEILCPPLVERLIKEEQRRLQELRQSPTTERQRADREHQRAERLAAKLRELGVDPDSV